MTITLKVGAGSSSSTVVLPDPVVGVTAGYLLDNNSNILTDGFGNRLLAR